MDNNIFESIQSRKNTDFTVSLINSIFNLIDTTLIDNKYSSVEIRKEILEAAYVNSIGLDVDEIEECIQDNLNDLIDKNTK